MLFCLDVLCLRCILLLRLAARSAAHHVLSHISFNMRRAKIFISSNPVRPPSSEAAIAICHSKYLRRLIFVTALAQFGIQISSPRSHSSILSLPAANRQEHRPQYASQDRLHFATVQPGSHATQHNSRECTLVHDKSQNRLGSGLSEPVTPARLA